MKRDKYTLTLAGRLEDMKARENYPLDDIGKGRLFAELFKDRHRYNATAGEWGFFDGLAWKADAHGLKAEKDAQVLADALLKYAADTKPEGQKDDYLAAAYKLTGTHERKKMLLDARSIYPIAEEQLDTNSDYFNCRNGVFDLKHMKLINHSPEQMISKISNVEYEPGANCPKWEKFLNEIMQGDQQKIGFLQRACGYALLGDPVEDCMFILYGATTRNGKSTFVNTIGGLFGDYAGNVQPETLAFRKKDSRTASGDIARLKGMRFVSTSEPPKNMMLDSQLLKQLTGRDKMTARRLRESEFEFVPAFAIFMNTNHLPDVRDDTVFSSGRLHVISFNRHFEAAEQDKSLPEKLKAEGSGIFNWMLSGLQSYRKNGLLVPESVRDETLKYQQGQDIIGQFLEDRFHRAPGCNVPVSKAYSLYTIWGADNGISTEASRAFKKELEKRHVLASSGTVKGKTVRNVLKGFAINRNE